MFTRATTISIILIALTASFNSFAAGKHGIIVKTGAYTLGSDTQTILGYSAKFDDSASSVFAIEYEYRIRNTVSIGGELVSYSNDYQVLGISGSADSTFATFNAKKYFDAATHFKPFVGAGIGAGSVEMNGPITGSESGLALQLMAGAEIPFDSVGIYLEYKYVSLEPEDAANQKVDTGGSGFFGGLSIRF